MPNPADNPTPRTKPRTMSWIIVGEFVLLVVMLGVWGFSRLEAGDAAPQSRDASPDDAQAARPPSNAPQGGAATRGIEFQTLAPASRPAEESADTEGSTVAELYRRSLPPLENPVILVEKSLLRLTVFDGRTPVKIYKAAVGGTAGHKQIEGDCRTPEGEYYVCVRKAAPATPYTRSLGLSYPNRRDAELALAEERISRTEHDRIVEAIRAGGQPPWTTPIGGAIMIHGKRNGGRDTQGCIALEDPDILELYPRIPRGTRVLIRP